MTRKRRSLVLTNEACRHPFRVSLPPHVAQPLTAGESMLSRFTLGDLRQFLSAYVASFVVISVFIG